MILVFELKELFILGIMTHFDVVLEGRFGLLALLAGHAVVVVLLRKEVREGVVQTYSCFCPSDVFGLGSLCLRLRA